LLAWLRRFGLVIKVGVEGTGTYGAGLARYLASEQVELVEVDRPDRKTRRVKGKSDPIDAIAAARAALSGQPQACRRLVSARSRRSAPCG
jgi:transposase